MTFMAGRPLWRKWNVSKLWLCLVLVCMVVAGNLCWIVNRQYAASFDSLEIEALDSEFVDDSLINGAEFNLLTGSRLEQNRNRCNGECTRKLQLSRVVDCSRLIKGKTNAQTAAKSYLQSHPQLNITDEEMVNSAENCTEYTATTFYAFKPLSEPEAHFPIAYSIVVHKNAYQLEKLLQAIYWPQNWYCIHLDRKSNSAIRKFVLNLVKCLPHVIIPTKREAVIYGGISRLKADLHCMEELQKENRTWKYLINLTGQEYPLKTNAELVAILRKYNGTSDIEREPQSRMPRFQERYSYHWKLDKKNKRLKRDKHTLKSPPPGNISLVKGSAFGAFTRNFIEFATRDKLAQELLTWLADTWSPDEVFWATVSTFGHYADGHPFDDQVTTPHRTWQAKYVVWPDTEPCHGIKVHWSCVFSYMDLPNMVKQPQLFANKFSVDYDYLALDCLEQWLHNRTYHRSISTNAPRPFFWR